MTTRDHKLPLVLILLCLGAGFNPSIRLLTPPASAATSQDQRGASQGANWTELGPGNVGGRTRALAIHPTNPDTIYAAAASGGVWKTTDGGARWAPLTDSLSNLAVNALALDGNDPNVIYAGTGEGFSNSDARRGVGIFKTTDGGATWTLLTGTRATDFYYVNDIVISRNNSQRVYAATNAGVFRSIDGGATWTRVLDSQSNGGCQDL
ncbi:MAG TPA: hypothetical protein VKE91_09595, partial [Blastocatellia bacterium]|nr:hypothetical protein [Blastocatellia bacterium]